MHSVGLHSALAINRQRKRREEMKKKRERRFSSQSTESGLGGSRSSCNSPASLGGSTDRLRSSRKRKAAGPAMADSKVVSSIAEEANMIGAMPAVAVRHERRRQEKRNKRPSLLYLQSAQSRSTSPSPVQSSPGLYSTPMLEIYILGKISLLHIAVVTMLAGAVTLFVGLVQLKPGAEASQYRYILIGSGLLCLLLGTLLAIIRCCLLPWVAKRRDAQRQSSRKQRDHKNNENISPTKPTLDTKIDNNTPGLQNQPTTDSNV